MRMDSLEESDIWQLMSPACHKCCDNSFMGEQILPLTVDDAREYLSDGDQPQHSESAVHDESAPGAIRKALDRAKEISSATKSW